MRRSEWFAARVNTGSVVHRVMEYEDEKYGVGNVVACGSGQKYGRHAYLHRTEDAVNCAKCARSVEARR